MLERRCSDAIVRVVCWPVAAAAFSAFFINKASAKITFCPTNRTLGANASCVANLSDFTDELLSRDPSAAITRDPVSRAQLGSGDSPVSFTSTETNGTAECGRLGNFDEPATSDGCAGANVTRMMSPHSQPEPETLSSLIWNAEELFCLVYLPSPAKPGKIKSTTKP